MPDLVSPPVEGYEILVRDFQWANARTDEERHRWAVADIKLYGRSLRLDFDKIIGFGMYTCSGQYSWPDMCSSKEEALQAGRKLVDLHRERCYSVASGT